MGQLAEFERKHWLCLQPKSDISQDLAFRGGIRSSSVSRKKSNSVGTEFMDTTISIWGFREKKIVNHAYNCNLCVREMKTVSH